MALIGHGRSSVGTAKAISKSAAAWMGCKRQKCCISGKPASWQVALVPGALTVVMESTAMGHLPARASLWIRPTKEVYHFGLHCETEQLNSVFCFFLVGEATE